MPRPDLSNQPWSLDRLPLPERQRVVAMAVSLEQAALAGQAAQPLRGKNLAVLCESTDCPGLALFCDAADALGARVAHIRPSDALASSFQRPDAVGALLGRLYDAIDCHGLAPDALEQLARDTGRPVFNALGCQAGAAGREDNAAPDRYTLQAMLLSALA